jgi:acetylornithine deacetylase/succinyl-diaminopimelate desuccinylase-like protein
MFYAAGIPTVYHGPMGSGAHGDVETIAVPELVRATQVYLALLERLWA